ncbi:uncharacterized protein NPIL_341231 [Nephila pilipes]|uniref:GLTSCR protein conserved domain-containing protein n=1 Tax=Nephila pilipes TaxID=299642 RepID=A0A8X6IK23_NEPPI|nr:uncharacterized protein NPIL_341231 [Nephila pilipes]
MKIQVNKVMKVKATYSSQRETVVTSSFRACSLAMDDGGRCLLDVINDPKLLQSFLESGSDENSKDPQDGTSSESAVESPQVPRSSQASLANHIPSADHVIDQADQMGYTYAVDSQALLAQSGVCSTTAGLGGMSLVVASSVGPQTYQHASSSGATIHHLPSTVTHVNLHPHSPASARSVTPISQNIKSPNVGPSSVHNMPPPSPLQQTRSPLPTHVPSPASPWSPASSVMSPAAATSRNQSSLPSVAFQQTHNQILQTSCNLTQFVTALTTPQSLTQKLTLQQQQQQQQQQVFLQQLPPVSQQQSASRLTAVPTPVVTTAAVAAVQPSMVQLIHAQPSNVALPTRTSHSNVRPIQPKLPPQILPKPATCSASNQFVTPAPTQKQTPPTPVTTGQRTVGVGIQPGAAGLVFNQAQPGVFSGPSGTFLLNQINLGVGQSPSVGQIVIQGNLSNLANIPGLLTLRPPNNVSTGQTLNSSNTQNNAALLAALQNTNQHTPLFAPPKQPIHGQQTIMIPNNIAHAGIASQNINLKSATIPNSGIISSSQGQNYLTRPNIIISPNQALQLQQIHTPTGPIFAFAPGQAAITVPHLPTALGSAQLAPVTVPMHGVMTTGQGVISGLSLQSHAPQSALQQQQQQSLFGTVPFTSHLEQSSHQVLQVPQPLAPHQVPTNHSSHLQNQPQQIEHSPKPASPPKPAQAPSVNLEELLKEHGIGPETCSSPDCNSPIIEEPVPSQPIVNSPHLITTLQQSPIILEQPQGHTPVKLAFTQDGSVIVQSQTTLNNTPRVQQYVSSGQIHGRTVSTTVGSIIFPTVTTSAVSVPVVTTESAPSRNHSTLIARLNAAPAISVPDVSSLALTTCAVTTTVTTSVTTLVPLTVQSLSVTNTPITSSYIVQRTNPLISAGDRVFVAEDVHTSQSHITPVISSSSSTQNVQNRINHSNSTFQTLIVPNEHPIRTIQQPPKIVQSSHGGAASTMNSQNVQPVLQKCGLKETHKTEIADNGTVVPSHNHSAFSSNVPNNVLLRVQKEIAELGLVKNRSAEQQKIFHQLIAAQQRMVPISNKNRGNRANQNQSQLIKFESNVDKLIQRAQASYSTSNESAQHLQMKGPVLTAQPSGQLEKQQNVNSKALNSHSVQLVNLLKQNSPQNATTKHITIASTTTVSGICDSTTTTVESSMTVHPKASQAISTAQPRLQTPHLQCTKTSNEVSQHQVIVRLQKPVQQQSVQSCPNPVQRKAPSPVKRIVNTALISEQLKKDQNRAVNPDVKTPFLSRYDACTRLFSYHVYNSNEPSAAEIAETDRRFQETSVLLVNRMKCLENRFCAAQLKSSMLPYPTSEKVQLERLLIEEEQVALQEDKTTIAEGKSLAIPPARQYWLQKMCRKTPSPVFSNFPDEEMQEEQNVFDHEDHDDCLCREASDHLTPEDSDPIYKEDDNLEAPVIDSCEDIVVPQHDDNCERSPPTLKRIVIKPNKCSESDSEDSTPMRKRVKFNSNTVFKSEASSLIQDSSIQRPLVAKHDEEIKTNHKYPFLSREMFHSDNRIDMVSELRKEFNMSPMEIDDDARVGSHLDFDTSSGVNHLVDFEPPVARTEESCDSNLLYNSSLRNNCTVKYDFSILNEWTEEYAHQPSETDVAVGNIISNHDNPSDLDLSGLDGLEDHLDDSQHCIPNGIQDDPCEESEMNYVGYQIPKHPKRFPDSSVQPMSNCSNNQTQSAIKSIIGPSTDNRSCYDSVNTDFMSLNRHSHNAHIGGYSSSMSTERGTTSKRKSEPDLDEAVRSILM